MRDAADFPPAIRTACQPEFVSGVEEHGIVSRNRSRRSAASGLERPNAAILFIFQGAINRRVETPGGEVGREPSIDRVSIVLIQPGVQFRDLSRRESFDRAFDVFDRAGDHTHLSD